MSFACRNQNLPFHSNVVPRVAKGTSSVTIHAKVLLASMNKCQVVMVVSIQSSPTIICLSREPDIKLCVILTEERISRWRRNTNVVRGDHIHACFTVHGDDFRLLAGNSIPFLFKNVICHGRSTRVVVNIKTRIRLLILNIECNGVIARKRWRW